MAWKIGEYRSKKIYKIGAKIVDVKVMFERLSRVHGRDEEDKLHLDAACRCAMKVGIHVLDGVILELKKEHVENSHADPEWQRVQPQRCPANFDDLAAKIANVRVMLDEVSTVRGFDEKDKEHLATANRYVMKVAAHVLDDVVWELNGERLARLHADPEWQKVEAESIRQIMEEYAERKDTEFHRLSEEAEESIR
jgi:hypothetical protein